MIQVNIQAETQWAQKFLRILSKDAYKKATARAINDTARTVRKEGAQLIRGRHKALRISDIKGDIRWRKAYPGRLWSTLKVSGKPLSLTKFRPHELKRGGVKVTIGTQRVNFTYRGRKLFRVAKFGNEIFARKFGGGRQIRQIRGPSLPGVFRARERQLQGIVRDRFPRNFRSRMQHEVDKAARKMRAQAQARAGAPSAGGVRGFTESQFGLLPGALR